MFSELHAGPNVVVEGFRADKMLCLGVPGGPIVCLGGCQGNKFCVCTVTDSPTCCCAPLCDVVRTLSSDVAGNVQVGFYKIMNFSLP